MANLADVTPEMIVWARELHGLSQQELANKVGVHENQIIKWEDAKTKPTFRQAIGLANALRIPFGYLFLSSPPKLEDPVPDLRTLRDRPLKRMSVNLRDTVYGVLNIQDWYREYRREYDAPALPFVGSFDTRADHNEVAASIRNRLSLNSALREEADNRSRYLSLLTDRAESAGILVMHNGVVGNDNRRTLSVDEFQGFVIIDDLAPVIFINTRDFVNARIFTLAHELAHIWIGKSGILNPDEANLPVQNPKSVELFCNAVAAETLVPRDEFLIAFEELNGSVESLATYFRVSPIVTVRRAFELGKITPENFYRKLKELQYVRRLAKRGTGGPPYSELVSARHSAKFMDAIVRDVQTGGTLLRDAAQLLHMKAPTLSRLAQTGEY